MTPLRVLKFGGSSVGAADRLIRVTDLIARERALGPIAVVVSAMGDTTDWLIDAARVAAKGDVLAADAILDRVASLAIDTGRGALRELLRRSSETDSASDPSDARAPHPDIPAHVTSLLLPLRQVLTGVALLRQCTPQTLDLVLSFGERLSASILAALLPLAGLPAVFVDARDWLVTDDRFGAALVDQDASHDRLAALRPGWGDVVAVHTGFLGATPDGRSTTLGRNGSDYTATLLASALRAAEVQIWTDVPGVMTGDPTILRDAYPIARMSYQEALELANFGARMFHPRTMVPLIERRIALRIRSTMDPDAEGTRIDERGAEAAGPTCVTSLEKLALLDLRWRRISHEAGVGARVLRALEQAGITVWMANQAAHGQAVAVVIPQESAEQASAAIDAELALERARGEVDSPGVRAPITLLTLVAERMDPRSAAAQFFRALGQVGVPVRAIAQGMSSRSISCAIDGGETALAVRTVHAAFNFAHEEISLLILGHGTVGAQLLAQIQQQQAALRKHHGIALRVVGLADRARALFEPQGLELGRWQAHLAEAPALASSDTLTALTPLLDRLRRLPAPVLVDCTAADGMGPVYAEAFARGIHVVSANKKPLTLGTGPDGQLRAAARSAHAAWRYETTVGASLPVIATLADLVRTGDRVHRVEGSFSGSLGYIAGEVMRGVPLSQAVRQARQRGYTEPHPRDDLSGLDVARKALILARELGLTLELAQIHVHPLVHSDLLAEDDLERFFTGLADYDSTFAASLAELKARGRVLRYLARIDLAPDTGEFRVRVGPIDVAPDHPAATLKGAEAFVAFTTERYEEYPLVVRGAGAGGAVTAAGVLADVLKIAQTLRGR
ncbi:MAG: bifunctional aspartate kinase/homoserine dehydrogenase I [Nannocystis sp.]|uniref:bifunctional aspartate kinase/homoserine dehydrogenase I n=1 Tax=Nannocystis sp. TaxID=1962667 RepID=UPI002423D5EA|nr:bifunctional aspartate kinase/homoserine dehydrogenase I [Nannocystis sp.]MBK9753723.1 bifunctional aspartate kinase/homoserine dehydrogenase I [Nannocystis sp.]